MHPDQLDTLQKARGLYLLWKQQRQAGENPSLRALVPDDSELRRTVADFIEDPHLAEEQFAAIEAEGVTIDQPAAEPPETVESPPVRPGGVPVIDGYEILGEIDAGGMGVVYKAVQLKLNRTVAVKTIHFVRLNQSKEIIRFLGEAEAVAAVDHPHVVRVFESGSACGVPYIAMEYLPGGTLAERIKRYGRLEPKIAAQLVRKIALGVQAAHDQQIIHRDLKPGNILFDADGEPRVTDFGLAKKRYSGDLTSTQSVMGTPEYMAPEQAMGESKYVGPPADVWALGVMLYEMLTGRRPFASADKMEAIRRITRDDPPDMRTVVPGVPQELELIVSKCLEKDPDARYRSARALARDLKRWLAGKDIDLTPATPTDRFFHYIERNRYGAILATMGLIILICLFVIFSLKSRLRQLEYGPDSRPRSQSGRTLGDPFSAARATTAT